MLRLMITVTVLADLMACQQSPVSSTGRADRQYLLTSRGAYVLSKPPPGIEVSVGSKVVRRVGLQDDAN
jgi:hypothetical protein